MPGIEIPGIKPIFFVHKELHNVENPTSTFKTTIAFYVWP